MNGPFFSDRLISALSFSFGLSHALLLRRWTMNLLLSFLLERVL